MTVLRAWLALEIRRRWRSLIVLALLTAVSAGVVMTSVAAARRGASSLTRLQDRTLPSTALILANTPHFTYWDKIAELPEVEVLTKFVVAYAIGIDGVDGYGIGFPFTDTNFGTTIERPVVLSGRNFDPERFDEAVVTRKFVQSYHKGVGDTVTLRLPSAKALASESVGEEPLKYDGPVVTIHIVGVVVSQWVSDNPDSSGGIQVSPGLAAKYPNEIIGYPTHPEAEQFINAMVRLRHGAADITALRNDVERVTGRSDIDILSMVDEGRSFQRNITFESRCLLAFGAAALVAAIFLVGQSIARYAAASAAELHTLRALGMTPAQSTGIAAAAPVAVGVLGGVLGAVGAWVASRWFPFGTAYYFEPAPGYSLDVLVLVGGALLVALLVAAGAVGAARLAVRADRTASPRRSTIAMTIGRAGVPVPVATGARFALEVGRGRTAVPVRPAIIGAVMGVLGVVAAFTFSTGVSDAADHPERFGQTFDVSSFAGINGQDFGPVDRIVSTYISSDLVTGVDKARIAVATDANGSTSISLWEYERLAKPLPVAVLDGRMPAAVDEVALAPKTLEALHARVGSTVTLVGSTGTPRTLRVTGSTLLPEGPHNGYADGGWIAPAAYDTLFEGFKYHVVLVSLKDGTNADAAVTSLTALLNNSIPELDGGADVSALELPSEVAQLRQVRTLPVVLGGFLALLALGAVGHALATAVRRRSRDLAVLRSLGMTPWQCRWVVVTQATILAVIGVVFGIPLGFALGRTVWRAVADYTPIVYVAPIATIALLAIGPVALGLANLLAAWPGRRAARLRISNVLRAE